MSRKFKKPTKDVFELVTDQIISSMIDDVVDGDWVKPWNGATGLPLRHNGSPYNGINIFVLWSVASQRGYKNNHWMTHNQMISYGGSFNCDARGQGVAVVFYKDLLIEDKDTGEDKLIPMPKKFRVFNVDLIDGLPEHFYQINEFTPKEHKPIEFVEKAIHDTGAKIEFGGNRAAYSPSLDRIYIPEMSSFDTIEGYYGTICHELIHWTAKRLDRPMSTNHASEEYAFEELIAELGSAYAMANFGLLNQHKMQQSTAYIALWLKRLKSDSKYIFKASSQAINAVKHLHFNSNTQQQDKYVKENIISKR